MFRGLATCTAPLLVLTAALHAAAQQPASPRFLDRIAVRWGYELAAVREQFPVEARARDPVSKRDSTAWVKLKHTTASHGLAVGVVGRVRPWWALGPELSAHEDFSAPTNPWLERTGVRFGKRRSLGAGVLFEFWPLQRTWGPPSGLLVRAGVRLLWTDCQIRRDADVVLPGEKGVFTEGMVWGGAGYSLLLGDRGSIELQGLTGLGPDLKLIGIRLGGGFR